MSPPPSRRHEAANATAKAEIEHLKLLIAKHAAHAVRSQPKPARSGQPQNLWRNPIRKPTCLLVADGVKPLIPATADCPNESCPVAR